MFVRSHGEGDTRCYDRQAWVAPLVRVTFFPLQKGRSSGNPFDGIPVGPKIQLIQICFEHLQQQNLNSSPSTPETLGESCAILLRLFHYIKT